MPPAVIGGVIAGVGAIGASVIGSKSNSKAIGKASDAQSAASAEATALQREIYNKNVGYQTPYLNTRATPDRSRSRSTTNHSKAATTGGTFWARSVPSGGSSNSSKILPQ
jgi:hypothetical protein